MKKSTFCAGCGHTAIARITEQFLQKESGIFVGSVGCSVSLPSDFEGIDTVSSAHGRALAVATGIRRTVGKDKPIVTIQGDGDLLNIGIGELTHTCLRNEKIICVLLNNSVFSMTGFQLSATTPLGMKTKTSPEGRNEKYHGIPINVKSLIQTINPKVKYFLTTSSSREGIDWFEAFLQDSLNYNGFTLIEVISPCVTLFGGDVKKSYGYSKKIFEEKDELFK